MKNRMLLLGGTNCVDDIVCYAKDHNITLIASGKYPDTVLKRISDESYDIDAVDIDGLVALIKEKDIDSIFMGCNEDIIPKAIEVAIRTNLPYYCNFKQWDICMNKEKFKNLCMNHNIPVAEKYEIDDLKSFDVFPVVVKPADSCGSQGFAICNSLDEVLEAQQEAIKFSRTSTVIIEKYLPYDSVIIHYTLINGNIFFTGMSDKKSGAIDGQKSMVMALQVFPSKKIQKYLETLNQKVIDMFNGLEMHDGAIWIEAFADDEKFYFNEMGYRFGGSMTYHPVKYFYGVNQLDLMMEYAMNGEILSKPVVSPLNNARKYCILPLHVGACTIKTVEGEEFVKGLDDVYEYVPIHCAGDVIKKSGTVNQVFCYMHILFDDVFSLKETIKKILENLRVYDDDGANQLLCLTDVDNLQENLI